MTVDTVLPPRCIATGAIVDSPGMIAPDYWSKLSFIDAPFCSCCGMPFDFHVDADALCGLCLYEQPAFDKARSALSYDDYSKKLVLAFKYGDQLHAAPTFAGWLARAGFDLLTETDAIIPVPLHRTRFWMRRFNQSAIIGQSLSAQTGIPFYADALKRTRKTLQHKGLTVRERIKNVDGAFELRERYAENFRDKTVVIIDDVYTTGATVKECAQTLKDAGAARVYVLTIARVLKEAKLGF